MEDGLDETSEPELSADEEALLREMPTLDNVGMPRRTFLGQTLGGGLGLFALMLLEKEQAMAALDTSPDAAFAADFAPENAVQIRLTVNGVLKTLEVDSRVVLLDALRERLELTGTKKGCDQGQCGACTVLIDGRRVVSCLTLAVMQEDHDITTIEGLGTPKDLHPMQAAFVKHDGFQCGFCTPGQICSAVAMLEEVKAGIPSHATGDLSQPPQPGNAEYRERMSGNVCRCGAYSNIQEAITEVASLKPGAR
jgi:xanthine dehydrogenase YagT iron-sulfur-binding subunit